MRIQPRFPGRVKVKTSMVSPYLGLLKLCRSLSHSTPSIDQRDSFRPGFVEFKRRSNTRKKDGLAKLFIRSAPRTEFHKCNIDAPASWLTTHFLESKHRLSAASLTTPTARKTATRTLAPFRSPRGDCTWRCVRCGRPNQS